MKPTYHLFNGVVASWLLASIMAPDARGAEASPLAKRITETKVFPERIVWVGDREPSEGESQALWDALEVIRPPKVDEGIAQVEQFISDHPASGWTPSLHSHLGVYNRTVGRYSLALQ